VIGLQIAAKLIISVLRAESDQVYASSGCQLEACKVENHEICIEYIGTIEPHTE